MHSKIQPAEANDWTPTNGKQDSKNHRILQQTKPLSHIHGTKVWQHELCIFKCRLTWYLFIVYRITDRGIETPTIACVDGIPYSKAHFFCRRTTGGQEGRGHRIISLIPWPMTHKDTTVTMCKYATKFCSYQNLCAVCNKSDTCLNL